MIALPADIRFSGDGMMGKRRRGRKPPVETGLQLNNHYEGSGGDIIA